MRVYLILYTLNTTDQKICTPFANLWLHHSLQGGDQISPPREKFWPTLFSKQMIFTSLDLDLSFLSWIFLITFKNKLEFRRDMINSDAHQQSVVRRKKADY